MTPAQPQETLSWSERLKQALNPTAIWENIKHSKDTLILITLFFGFGFFTGFFLKRFGHYIVACLLFVVVLIALQHFNLISFSVNWSALNELIGLKNVSGQPLVPLYWQWIKSNIAAVFSFVIGFLLGLRFA